MLDKFTEQIAYFIGMFQLMSEAARGRVEYDSFKNAQAQQNLDLVFPALFARDFNYLPNGYSPQARDGVASKFQPINELFQLPQQPVGQLMVQLPFLGEALPQFLGRLPTAENVQSPEIPQLHPPGSSAFFTDQQNILTDQDMLGVDADLAGAWLAFQADVLGALQQDANALQILHMGTFMGASGLGLSEAAQQVQTARANAEAIADARPDADLYFATGAMVSGVTLNGVNNDAGGREDMPVWSDLLPETARPELPEDGQDTASPWAVAMAEADHVLTMGNNTAINETNVVSGGVDAPVIAVAGDVVSLDVISQVNVLSDDGTLPGAGRPIHRAEGDDNLVLNAAWFAGQSEVIAELPEHDEEEAAETFSGQIFMSVLKGDLLNFSWSQQVNIGGDEDAVSFSISGDETWISTGNNQMINATALSVFGVGYDLIVAGGNMISQFSIQQTNVLADVDGGWSVHQEVPGLVTASDLFPDAFDHAAQSHGNVAINSASITHGGLDLIYALDQDKDGLMGSFDPAAPDLSFFNGLGLLPDSEFLSVLYVEGDLLNLHTVSQVNVMGDGDLLLQDAVEAGAEIMTGHNATVNSANLNNLGMDSLVLASGEVFSDAVLYQANLISQDAPPTDVFLDANGAGDLASEAVVFLADGTETPLSIGEGDGFGSVTLPEGVVQVDVMQTMLA